jgi:hypothetical protein
MRLGSLVLRSSTASASKFRPPSTGTTSKSKDGGKEEETNPKTIVPARKQKLQEGESSTTNKVEQQIKDHKTEEEQHDRLL